MSLYPKLSPRSRRATAAACLLTLLATAAPAQEAGSTAGEPNTFGETLEVVVVQVEAVVTDPQGRRVTGLGKEDFRLVVDGRERPIEYFSEIREGREVVAAAAAGDHSADAEAPVPETLGEAAETDHLVFVDDYFGIKRPRNRSLHGIGDQLSALPPRDRVAVVAFDGNQIDVLTSWTSEPEEVRRALDQAAARPTYGLLRASEKRRRGDAGPWSDAVSQEQELRRVLTAVRSTLRILPRPDGRKVLLLLGGSWPTRPLIPTTDESDGRFRPLPTTTTREGRFDDRALVQALADSANLLGYTFYPVDVEGLRATASDPEAEAPGTDSETGLASQSSPNTRELFRQGALRFLAEETGGRALLYADRDRALERELADTRTYYSVGFTPRLRGDGSHHDVRLEVRRPGLHVRARAGFEDVSRAAELNRMAESALRLGGAAGSAAPESGGLRVTVGEPQPRAHRTMQAKLRVDLPWREVTLVPTNGALVGQIEIRVAARDRDGTVSQVARVPLPLKRDRPPAPGKVLRWEADLTLRRERNDLVVSVYDTVSGQVRTQRVTVEP